MKILLLISFFLFTLSGEGLSQVPSYVPANGLIGWWPFNATADDESINANHGTLSGGGYFVSDRFYSTNRAYQGTGQSGIDILTNNFPTGNAARSISVWFKSNIPFVAPHRILFAYGENLLGKRYGIGYNGTHLYVESVNSGVTIPFTNDTLWHNFIVTYPSGGLGSASFKLYLDGVLTPSSIINPISALNTNLIQSHTIGSLWTLPNYYYSWIGSVDDIGFWNRELSLEEITSLYQGCELSVATQPIDISVPVANNGLFICTGSHPGATYQWQTNTGAGFYDVTNGGQYTGATNDSLTVSNITMSNHLQMFRCIINASSCFDTSSVASIIVQNSLGLTSLSDKKVPLIYPNPCSDYIMINNCSSIPDGWFTLSDQLGHILKRGKLLKEETLMELESISTGIYFLRIDGLIQHTFKVIKR